MADAMADWFFLPSPATLRFPFAFTNQQGATRYVQTKLTGANGGNLPSGWTDTVKQHGSLAHGATLYAYHQAARTVPTFTSGEYSETIELRIELYTDSGYNTLDKVLVEPLNYIHYKSDDSAFTLVDEDTFEIDPENWSTSSSLGNTWNINNNNPRVSGRGYASTYAAEVYDYTVPNAGSLRILLGDGNLTAGQGYNVETRMWLDTKGLGIADVWHTFAGRHSLSGSNVGLVLISDPTNPYYASFKKFAKPTSATKLYVSGVVYYHSSDYVWYFDRVRWVKK